MSAEVAMSLSPVARRDRAAPAQRPRAELAIVVVDPQGRVLGADADFLRLTGYVREEVEGRDFKSVVIFDDPIQGPDLLRGSQRSASGRYVDKMGTRWPATFTLAPVTDDQNTFAAMTIVLWRTRTAPRVPAMAPLRVHQGGVMSEHATVHAQPLAEAK